MNKYGYNFITEKQNKTYKVYSKLYHLKVSEAKTKKEALLLADKILSDQGKQKTIEAFNRHKKKRIKNKVFNKLQPLFKSIFDFPCPVCSISLISGIKRIDAVRFDRLINTPANISTYDHITNKYGLKAKKLIKKLI